MPYIGNASANRFVASKAATQFSGDGSTTAFTLDHSVGADEDILVSVDGVVQEPSVAYAVSGTTLTFTAAPSSNSGNNIFVYYLFRTVGTVSHPSNNALSATSGTFTGNVVIPDAGNIGSASDTDAIAISSGGVVTFSQTPVGAFISEVDQFRLTANLTDNASNYITSNFERVDNGAFSKIGTGMSESSGTFTFPRTGLYRIGVVAHLYIPDSNDGAVGVDTYFSDDNFSSTQQLATAWAGDNDGSGQWYGTHSSECFVNITNASTMKIRFATNSSSDSVLVGSTSINQTSFSFIRLGESQ